VLRGQIRDLAPGHRAAFDDAFPVSDPGFSDGWIRGAKALAAPNSFAELRFEGQQILAELRFGVRDRLDHRLLLHEWRGYSAIGGSDAMGH
jgi:hypothetical protein